MPAPSINLADKGSIPQIGLGLWKVKDDAQFRSSVLTALEAGYRHFDTAQIYGNEALLGEVLQEAGVPREELFITTKIWIKNFGYKQVGATFEESLEKLQTSYVDLLLLHFPVTILRRKAWEALEALHAAGKAKHIGVSNYTVRHLQELEKHAKIRPAVNQVELHVFLQQPELLNYCRERGIAIEAYSPLAHARNMDNPVIQKIADKHDKSYAQIMLRWCVEQDAIVLVKSVTPERVRQNMDIFDFSLDDEDKQQLETLDQDLRTCWNPTHVP